MTVSMRYLIPLADLPRWQADGWTLVYLCAGGLRVEGEAAVIEWRAP